MQPASSLPALSFRKTPRKGQRQAFEELVGRDRLNVQNPTGYGKTFVMLGSYSYKKAMGKANRLYAIFPTAAQLEQFIKDAPRDLADVCVDGPLAVIDVGYFRLEALKRHLKNQNQIFATTIQALITEKGITLANELMQKGQWMVAVDEYHHYGDEKVWGTVIKRLTDTAAFRLALSATPHREKGDGAFGAPDISITYRSAVDEKAVKPLRGHSYIYRIDAILENGDVTTYTTTELAAAAGGNTPEGVEKYRIQKKMRWSPKYVSPLVSVPLERMIRERTKSGFRLQALVGAMCVSHAELVCDQIRAMYPDLSVDWAGTGPNGRTDEENRKVLAKFCPPKDDRGNRNHELDVLVHVGLAGEGLDSTHVSEVIHLNPASNNQENGRASRYLPGVVGHINFDSCSEYAIRGYVGDAIMDAMDSAAPNSQDDQGEKGDLADEGDEEDMPSLPEEPTIQIWDMVLEGINSGDPEVQLYIRWLAEEGHCGFTREDLTNPDSELHTLGVEGYKNMRRKEAEQHNEKAIVVQWADQVSSALSATVGRIMRTMSKNGQRVERSLAGDIKKRINSRKKHVLGEVAKDENTYRSHYDWLRNLDEQIKAKGGPAWLV